MAFSSDYVVEEIREETQERREDTEACASRPSSQTEKILEILLTKVTELNRGRSEMENRLTQGQTESRRQKQLTQLIKPPLELAHQEISLGRFEEDHSRVTSAMSPRGIVESRSHI